VQSELLAVAFQRERERTQRGGVFRRCWNGDTPFFRTNIHRKIRFPPSFPHSPLPRTDCVLVGSHPPSAPDKKRPSKSAHDPIPSHLLSPLLSSPPRSDITLLEEDCAYFSLSNPMTRGRIPLQKRIGLGSEQALSRSTPSIHKRKYNRTEIAPHFYL